MKAINNTNLWSDFICNILLHSLSKRNVKSHKLFDKRRKREREKREVFSRFFLRKKISRFLAFKKGRNDIFWYCIFPTKNTLVFSLSLFQIILVSVNSFLDKRWHKIGVIFSCKFAQKIEQFFIIFKVVWNTKKVLIFGSFCKQKSL